MRNAGLVAPALLLLAVLPVGCARQNKGLKNITRRDLEQPTDIQGVPCERFAVFFEKGNLLTCALSREADIGKAHLPRGTTVRFNADGTLRYAFLPEDTEIEGHLCKGGGHGSMTTFHPSGRLKLCWLARDEEIQGIPCVKSTVRGEILGRLAGRGGPGVVFHESGRLHSCKLSRDLVLQEREYKKGRRITLDEHGTPVSP